MKAMNNLSFLILLLGLTITIPAFSQNSCNPNNMNYWTVVMLTNKSKIALNYELKINDSSPSAYLSKTTANEYGKNQSKQVKGSALPLSEEQDNNVYYIVFSCTASPIDLTLKVTKGDKKAKCTAQIKNNGMMSASCLNQPFVTINSNNFIFN